MFTTEQMANLDAAQRQNARHLPMLLDRARSADKSAREKLARKEVVYQYGNFLASLIPSGGWWMTITIADRSQTSRMRRHGKRTLRGKVKRHYRDCRIRYGQPDVKIKAWRPASKLNTPWTPFTHKILAEVRLFMEMLEQSVGAPIGYIIAEEIGELNGRWHLHLLISGVTSDIRRKIWWSAAFQIWGRTRIDSYDPKRAAAFYAAKYAAKKLGAIHLCGTLRGKSMEDCGNKNRGVAVGGQDVARSPEMSEEFFHSPVVAFRKPQFSRPMPANVWRHIPIVLKLRNARRTPKQIASKRIDDFRNLGFPWRGHVAYTDGAARGNPGSAACAFVLYAPDGKTLCAFSKKLGDAKNNFAEYCGLIAALEYAVEHGIRDLLVRSDSKLMVFQMRGRWGVNDPELKVMNGRARALVLKLDFFKIEHVRREFNSEADALGNAALNADALAAARAPLYRSRIGVR